MGSLDSFLVGRLSTAVGLDSYAAAVAAICILFLAVGIHLFGGNRFLEKEDFGIRGCCIAGFRSAGERGSFLVEEFSIFAYIVRFSKRAMSKRCSREPVIPPPCPWVLSFMSCCILFLMASTSASCIFFFKKFISYYN